MLVTRNSYHSLSRLRSIALTHAWRAPRHHASSPKPWYYPPVLMCALPDGLPFRVWAPRASRVELVASGIRSALRPVAGGYHELDEARLDLTRDYALRLDGGPPLPDPRSEHQPEGIEGPSRRVDHAAFAWSDAGFTPVPLARAVAYELHVGTFSDSGTFEGVIEHLPHLAELGVTHVELMPVCEFGGRHGWGYDGVNLFAPHHGYGGPLGLKRLVDACHARGLAVILDVVYNHLGPRGNHLGRFGPYFTGRHTPWGAAVNLRDAGSDEVRRFFVDNALSWLTHYHVDALRLDAVQTFDDDRAFPFLAELAREVEVAGAARGKRWELIAECDRSDPRTTTALGEGGLGMSAQWSDDLQFALSAYFTGERNGRLQDFGGLDAVAHVLEQGFFHHGTFSAFRGRLHGHPLLVPAKGRLVGYLQTHDQVGNRPRGERISALVTANALRQLSALVLLGPFLPMLFQGEEWAATTPFFYFTDHGDAALARNVKEGREREYRALGFELGGAVDPESEAAFARSRLAWRELESAPHRDVLEWYRSLIRLRRELANPGELPARVSFDRAEGWLLLDRDQVVVGICCAEEPRELPLRASAELALKSGDIELKSDRVRIGPQGVAVLRR